jgi:hypothetical protein
MTRYAPQWLQAGSYSAAVDRRLMGALWPAPASVGCAVSVASGMTVNVASGQVAVPSGNNTGSILCSSDAVEPVVLAAAPASGSNRIDLVVCQARGNDLDGGANNDFLFTTVTGTAAASPTVPATPANAVALAQIFIPGGSASVTAGNITDVRPGFLSVSSAITRVFATAAVRDAQWANPPNGAECITLDTGTKWERINGQWYTPFGMLARALFSTTVPGVGSGGYDLTQTVAVNMPIARRLIIRGQVNISGTGTLTYLVAKYQVGAGALTPLPSRMAQNNAGTGILAGQQTFIPAGIPGGGSTIKVNLGLTGTSGTVQIEGAADPGVTELWDGGGL